MAQTKYVIDLDKVTIAEYRKFAQSPMRDGECDGILAAAAGLTVEQVGALTFNDYRRLVRAFFQAAQEPLADPT